jgi:hypothetical protein
VSISIRVRVLAALVGLVAPLSLGLSANAGSAAPAAATAPAATAEKVPVQRYIKALVNKKEVKKGRKVRIYGAVEAPGAHTCAVGVVLNVERSTRGAIYRVVDTVTTDGTGSFAIRQKVTKKSRFRLSAPATDACTALQSPPRTVSIITP